MQSTSLPIRSGALERRLGLWVAASVVVGNVIGSGIFRVPSVVADQTDSAPVFLLIWALGGLIALCGALSLAELATMFPRSGGIYVYLRETYGPLIAFLFGWTTLLMEPAAAAAVGLVFAEYLSTFVPLSQTGIRLIAAGVLLTTGAISYMSVRGAGAVQGASAGAKVLALVGLIVAAFALGDGAGGALVPEAPAESGAWSWGGIGLGLIAVLWAYNSWQDVGTIAGEIQDPERNLPRALIAGTLVVIVVYLGANAAYLYVLPLAEIRASPLVATDVAARLLGGAASGVIAALVMTSAFGSINGHVLAVPRIYFAMARDGLLFRQLAAIHPRHGTPHAAIAFHTALGLVFVATRTFEQLVQTFVLSLWPFLALAAFAVILLRRRRPDLPRTYRTPGYPLVPLAFICASGLMIGNALYEQPLSTALCFGVVLLGVPLYFVPRLRRGGA